MFKKIILWMLVISCMVTIFAFSSQEATESKKTSSKFITSVIRLLDVNKSLSHQEIENIAEKITTLVRKSAHFSIYALLGLLVALLFSQYGIVGKRQLLFAVLWVFLYACSDEFHQTFVEGRSGEVRDILIDTAGGFCGAGFIIMVVALIKRIHKRRDENGF